MADSPATRIVSGCHADWGAPRGHTDQVRALFDSKAPDWPGKYKSRGRLAGRITQFGDAVRAQAVPGTELLDLGCGSGDLARRLAADGYRVTGCDIAPEMLRQAAAADPERTVEWILLDPAWRTLPFADGSLGMIIAASVLEYVPNPATVLRECARVLRPGGGLVVTVPDLAHPVRWLEWPLILVARTHPARAAGKAWPVLGRYLAYLTISRQRRRSRWWLTAGRQAGFQYVPPVTTQPRAPLRLLSFARPGDARA